MKWWQASLAVALYYLAFAVVAVGWHRYLATDLPLAVPMRHVYLFANRFGYLMFYGFPDTLLPIAVLGFGIGVIGRRQRPLFVIIQASWIGLAAVALMPLYTHWLHPVPRPKDWPLYRWGWGLLAKPDAIFSIVGIVMGALSVQHGWRVALDTAKKGTTQAQARSNGPSAKRQSHSDYRSDAARVTQIMHEMNYSVRKAVELVDREGAARDQSRSEGTGPAGATSGRDSPHGEPSVYGSGEAENRPPAYTPQQIDGIILLMCARGWSVEQAAKNFRINPEELRERLRDFSTHHTPERLSAVLGVMRERGWTIQQAAKRFQVPEKALRQRVSETG